MLPYEVYAQLQDEIDQLRLEAADGVMARIEHVITDPSNAVTVKRRRRR